MTALTRRHILAGAAAVAAAATLSAAAVAAEQVTYMDPAELAWAPETSYVRRQIITIDNRLHVVLFDHFSEEAPSDRYISRPLRVGDNGRFIEDVAGEPAYA